MAGRSSGPPWRGWPDLLFRRVGFALVTILLAACQTVSTGDSSVSLSPAAPAAASTPSSPANPSVSPSPAALNSTAPSAGASPSGSSSPTASAAGLPSVGHIFIIVMENKEYGQLVGSPQAPYLNSLARRYALATNYYAVTHPSLPNYLALLGGDTFGVSSDCTGCFVNQPNLVDQLEAHGKTWKGYMEDLPGPCFLGAVAQGASSDGTPATYALKHDPFLYFQDVRNNPARCRLVVPLTHLTTDLASGSVPDFSWITPNLYHDMHDGTVADGDRWLSAFVPSLLSSSLWEHDGLLIIVWDEGVSDQGCCGVPGGGHVPALFISPLVRSGYQSAVNTSHYGLLRTIEDLWVLGHIGKTASATPLLDVFRSS